MPKFFLLFYTAIIMHFAGNAQNVGIGTVAPAYKLQINNAPLLDTTFLQITNKTTGSTSGDGLLLGMAGKSTIIGNLEDGNLRLATKGFTRLAIDSAGNVGIGPFITGFPDYKLDVSGDINTTGLIRLNGDPGITGQVLASNGTSDPTWVNSAYGNTVRFYVTTYQNSGASTSVNLGGILSNIATKYNLDPSAVTINSNTIVINKSGLYHFEGSIYSYLYYNASVTPGLPPQVNWFANFDYIGAGMYNYFKYSEPMRKNKLTPAQYFFDNHFSADIHIVAPKTIVLISNISGVDGPTNSVLQEGTFSGYLMSP